MRRKDREMNRDFALMVVDTCEYAVLSLIRPDGSPYAVPVSIARDQDSIYFHGAPAGEKAEAMEANPRVSLACVGATHRMEHEFTTEYESAIVFGTAARVTEEAELLYALRLICERHTPLNMDRFDEEVARSLTRTAVWRIAIDSVTGKRKKYGRDGKELKFGRMED